MAIVRYLARKSGKLYGKNAIETASIDQWLEYINSQISGYQRILIFGLLGFAMSLPVTNKERYNQVKKEFLDMMKDIDTGLKGQDYLVKDMSVADVVLAVHLRYFFTLMFDEKIRSSFPNLTKWFVRMAEKPAFMNYFGKTWLCKKEVVPNYEYFAKV